MAQTSVVAFGIYQMLLDKKRDPSVDLSRFVSLFSECQAEFLRPVDPGTLVTIRGEKVYWRRKKLRATATMRDEAGEILATATLSGMGVQL
jgi:acyl-coenzyme A thioesterase PaaI-like protein